ncbi:hypothetical protein DICVIV_06672 [Dictyocaulus viviparus]|uniref:Uncharacterized protein n=1 Tax=Dictyocaulus viviparus TaxID=29172 RepID=A0A0D8XRD4_DICVI|nr:hypothetical protein DICVIV_06672 [Dictyocaulus viviparus]
MATRGRASTGRRNILPNLSLAGKREEKAVPVLLKRKKAGQSRKGRGRESQKVKERPGLIESSGIFSEGLSCIDSLRRCRSVRNEQAPSSLSRVKEESVNLCDSENVQSSYISYDELWQSDNEADIEELSDLFKDGFISDIKQATVLPHVLPVVLESQFVELMHNDVKQNILDQDYDMKRELDLDIKEHIIRETIEEQMYDDETPTAKRSRKASRILRKMDKGEGHENEFFIIQLPTVLKLLCQEKQSEDKVIFHSSRSNGGSQQTDIEDRIDDASCNVYEQTTIEQMGLPFGRYVGKLVVKKAGHVLLMIGGHSMDVAHTTSQGQHQSIVMVETNPRASAGPTMENGTARFGNWFGSDNSKNAVYYIGDVHHHFTASLDWKSLRPIGVENSSSIVSDSVFSSKKMAIPTEIDSIQKELFELKQKISLDIATSLKRWNI